jgi:hypothetical protein
MDVIENGDPAAGSALWRAAWIVGALVVLGALAVWRMASPDPHATRGAVATPSLRLVTPVDPGPSDDTAVVSLQLGELAMSELPPARVKGAFPVIGTNYINGVARTGVEDQSMPDRGRYDVTVRCVGTGRIELWLSDVADAGGARAFHDYLPCDGTLRRVRVDLTTPSLQIEAVPDPQTAASLAYAVNPAG